MRFASDRHQRRATTLALAALVLSLGCTRALIEKPDSGADAGTGGTGGAGTGQGGASGSGGTGAGGHGGADAGAGGAGGRLDAADAPEAADAADAPVDMPVDMAADLGTPDVQEARPFPMPAVAGALVVSELMNDPSVVNDTVGEWFEIYNPSDTTTYDVMGCTIQDSGGNAHTIGRSVPVPPHAFRTLALFATGGGFMPDYTYTNVYLNNGAADSVSIACDGTVIDTFAYSAADSGVSGKSFSVDPAHYDAADNDAPGNFCRGIDAYNERATDAGVIRDYGTPGAPNPPCS